MKLLVMRDITTDECPWLIENINVGAEVYEYYGATYGCVSPTGIAVTKEEGRIPFFELPCNALLEVNGQ